MKRHSDASGFDDFESDHDMPCPGCGENLNGHLAAQRNSQQPKPGDPGICAYCSTLIVYTMTDGRLGLRHPDEQEFAAIMADPRAAAAIAAIRYRREHRKGT